MKGVHYLLTGGAGFIGSHLCELLLSQGHKVTILDSFVKQVHGSQRPNMKYLKGATIVDGDIRDRDVLKKVMVDVDGIVNLAAEVGIGQSQYEIRRYTDANCTGTAALWDEIVKGKHNLKSFVQISTMSNYGEGAYNCENCGVVYPGERHFDKIDRNRVSDEKYWDPQCPLCGGEITPIPTSESAPLHPTSVYAASKRYQEELSLLMSRIYDIPVSALRLFNVLGARQALGNPYTGVAAIFTTSIKNNDTARIYEDGRQSRDFVDVRDVARAIDLALESQAEGVFNIGSGRAHTILDVYNTISDIMGIHIEPKITYSFRSGDVRHVLADISQASEVLHYSPQYKFSDSIEYFVRWAQDQEGTIRWDRPEDSDIIHRPSN